MSRYRPVRDNAGRVAFFVETLRTVRQASGKAGGDGTGGTLPAFNRMLERLMRVAPSEAAVLLLGETGTGKELAARLVHEASPRERSVCRGGLLRDSPIPCSRASCSATRRARLPAPTSARRAWWRRRAGGTLFLDEVGDIPLSLQVKLLRLLETGSYRRVGSVESLHANFRLVCATHRDLPAMVGRRRFAATCTTGSTRFRCGCLPWPSVATTFPCWWSRCWSGSAAARTPSFPGGNRLSEEPLL